MPDARIQGARTPSPHLDDSAYPAAAALEEAGVPAPDALLLLATGLGTLPGSLSDLRRVELESIEGTPDAWKREVLLCGRIGRTRVWMLEDAPGGLEFGEVEESASPAWASAWPVWLAAAAGAMVLIHTSGGTALEVEDAPETGTLALVSDHVNLSGRTPLLGLGETRLGPLFPDQTRVHRGELRVLARRAAAERGIPLTEAIAACTTGPALTTPAELRWMATTGAHVAVQRLADPLLAAAHASLATAAFVAITDRGQERLAMEELVARAEATAPALEDIVLAVTPELARLAETLREEEGA